MPKMNIPIANERSLFHLALAAEPENLGACSRSEFDTRCIVRVEHGKVVGCLVLENARLRIHVVSKRTMTVKMVGRYIQHNSNFGVKAADGFELKTRNLEHNCGFRCGLVHQGNRRFADVSADQGLEPAFRQNLAHQSGGCRFPV